MSAFANAPVSKAVLLCLCTSTFLAGAFARKYYFNVPLSPHLTRDGAVWRLATHHLVFANSSELLVGVMLLFTLSIAMERTYGSLKYASFLAVCAVLTSLLELLALLTCYKLGFTAVPAGPFGLIFALIYQYYRTVPASWQFRVAGISFTNKSFVYLLAFQLFFAQPFTTCIPSLCGLLSGALYRADGLGLRAYRLPRPLVRLAARTLGPLLASGPASSRPARRTTHASLADLPAPVGLTSSFAGLAAGTTASTTRRNATPAAVQIPNAPGTQPARAPPRAGRRRVLTEWAETFAGTAQARPPPAPSADQIASLQAMFPDASAQAVTDALTNSGNDVNRAVERLLSAG